MLNLLEVKDWPPSGKCLPHFSPVVAESWACGLQCSLLRDVLWENSSSIVERLREGREPREQLDESIADLNATLSDLLVFSKDIALHIDSCDLNSFLRRRLLRKSVFIE